MRNTHGHTRTTAGGGGHPDDRQSQACEEESDRRRLLAGIKAETVGRSTSEQASKRVGFVGPRLAQGFRGPRGKAQAGERSSRRTTVEVVLVCTMTKAMMIFLILLLVQLVLAIALKMVPTIDIEWWMSLILPLLINVGSLVIFLLWSGNRAKHNPLISPDSRLEVMTGVNDIHKKYLCSDDLTILEELAQSILKKYCSFQTKHGMITLTGEIRWGLHTILMKDSFASNGSLVRVAIKFPHNLEETSLEARKTITELKVYRFLPLHDNIVHFYDGIGDESNDGSAAPKGNCPAVCIIMELMHTSLSTIIHDPSFSGFFKWKDLVRIWKDIINGLVHLHDNGFMHNNLTSKKVMCNKNPFEHRDWRFKVGGFICSGRSHGDRYTEENFNEAFPYLPPELLLYKLFRQTGTNGGPPKYNAQKVDTYSFGIIMWECITQKYPPFIPDVRTFDDADELIPKLSFGPQVPGELQGIFWDCVNLDPEKRPSFHKLQERFDMSDNSQWINWPIE